MHLRRGEIDAADHLLTQAEKSALALGTRWQLPEVYRLRAEWHLRLGEWQLAHDSVSQALVLAEELDLPVEAGIALRVLGQAQAAKSEDATEAFQRSLDTLLNHDPYRGGRTQAAWGTVCFLTDESIAKRLLDAARNTFAALGATYDLLSLTTVT